MFDNSNVETVLYLVFVGKLPVRLLLERSKYCRVETDEGLIFDKSSSQEPVRPQFAIFSDIIISKNIEVGFQFHKLFEMSKFCTDVELFSTVNKSSVWLQLRSFKLLLKNCIFSGIVPIGLFDKSKLNILIQIDEEVFEQLREVILLLFNSTTGMW